MLEKLWELLRAIPTAFEAFERSNCSFDPPDDEWETALDFRRYRIKVDADELANLAKKCNHPALARILSIVKRANEEATWIARKGCNIHTTYFDPKAAQEIRRRIDSSILPLSVECHQLAEELRLQQSAVSPPPPRVVNVWDVLPHVENLLPKLDRILESADQLKQPESEIGERESRRAEFQRLVRYVEDTRGPLFAAFRNAMQPEDICNALVMDLVDTVNRVRLAICGMVHSSFGIRFFPMAENATTGESSIGYWQKRDSEPHISQYSGMKPVPPINPKSMERLQSAAVELRRVCGECQQLPLELRRPPMTLGDMLSELACAEQAAELGRNASTKTRGFDFSTVQAYVNLVIQYANQEREHRKRIAECPESLMLQTLCAAEGIEFSRQSLMKLAGAAALRRKTTIDKIGALSLSEVVEMLSPDGGDRWTDAGAKNQSDDPSPEVEFVFRLEGMNFIVRAFGESGTISASFKGMRQIHKLIQTPGRSISYLDLDDVTVTEKQQAAADQRSRQPPLDTEGFADIRKKIQELKQDFAEANAGYNDTEAERISSEIDSLELILRDAAGFRGKGADLNNAANDRLRPKIAGTISTACKKMRGGNLNKTADHFETTIAADGTGTGYRYSPGINPPPDWKV